MISRKPQGINTRCSAGKVCTSVGLWGRNEGDWASARRRNVYCASPRTIHTGKKPGMCRQAKNTHDSLTRQLLKGLLFSGPLLTRIHKTGHYTLSFVIPYCEFSPMSLYSICKCCVILRECNLSFRHFSH